jgi:hypothetical protein
LAMRLAVDELEWLSRVLAERAEEKRREVGEELRLPGCLGAREEDCRLVRGRSQQRERPGLEMEVRFGRPSLGRLCPHLKRWRGRAHRPCGTSSRQEGGPVPFP